MLLCTVNYTERKNTKVKILPVTYLYKKISDWSVNTVTENTLGFALLQSIFGPKENITEN